MGLDQQGSEPVDLCQPAAGQPEEAGQDQPQASPQAPAYQRRLRYRGTHPKAFAEKYKELQPERYQEAVAHIIAGGHTPAGMHLPICVEEILAFLQIKPGQRGLDATLGYGGHARRLLEALQPGGCLYAIDVDPQQLPRTRDRLLRLGYGPEQLRLRQMNFSRLDELVGESGPLQFILADLGVSSMQIDDPARGFSFRHEGPLDLRLDPGAGKPAAERLRLMTAAEIEGMLRENADEPQAALLARAIAAARRKGQPLKTTTQLRDLIEETLRPLPGMGEEEIKKACQRCFQALRIDVNRELEALDAFLEKLPGALAPGGRVAILSFHSGEDRLVKQSFRRLLREGVYREVAPDPIRPGPEECRANSRARSAKLRWAIRA
ncbi:MAG: 16S rRNA (cytosine(1402)-N(4))-methyltransferase RsmH [Christensenellales bacterium]